ncbi:hypothetical protein J437_LFUL014749 [Ladona fulva]|uniref:Transposable element P transposase-like RNase H domain-containing protein n=1 Tax=Ladona fulva TaxID=123851 RepID=A0A8K0KJ51_LADFU|nr:hypothetical protein J437_LFUL014749 [Ladona fulva]
MRDLGIIKKNLTPKKRLLYHKLIKEHRYPNYFKSKKSQSSEINDLNSSFRLVVDSHLQDFKRKPKERRWILHKKLFFMTFYKQNPQVYAYMKKYFLFPSAQTLLSVLNAVPFRVGLNPGVLEDLSFRVSWMSELDKHCMLIFDKMSIKPSFAFNSRANCIDGFEDHGSRKYSIRFRAVSLNIHFLSQCLKYGVFPKFVDMKTKSTTPAALKSLRKAKTSGRLSDVAQEALVFMADLIREVLGALQSTGLKIAATVCDMGQQHLGSPNIRIHF